jgi:GTP pyrophosphokinase
VNCPNAVSFLGSDRITDVEWIDIPGEDFFAVRLDIAAENRQGILAEITSAISNLKTNIVESRSTTDGGRGMVEVTVEIHDIRHLRKVIQALKGIRGIHEVERVSKL